MNTKTTKSRTGNESPDWMRDVSPEMEIILLCIGAMREGTAAVEEKLKKGSDWARLEKLALDHKVLPLLYNRLSALPDAALSREAINRINSIYKLNALRNLRLSQSLLRLLDLLSENKIEAIPFKGPALAVQAYGDLSLRTISDLDFLVHTEDFPAIYDMMIRSGAQSTFPLDEKMKEYCRLFRRDLGFNDSVSWIDFHHRFTQGPARISLKEKTWQNRKNIELLDREIPVLSPEHALLCTCMNGTKENWRYLRSLADITHLISRHPDLDWGTLIADAEKIGCLRMLQIGLHLCRQVGALELSEEIPVFRRRQGRVEKLAGKYFRKMLKGDSKPNKWQGTTALLESLDSVVPRVSLLVDFLFVPTPSDWMMIKLPLFFRHLYYIVRPMRLFSRLIARSINRFFRHCH